MRVAARCWNVCGLDPASLDGAAFASAVAEWLGEGAAASDVASVGLVEVVELKPGTVVRESFVSPEASALVAARLAAWRAALLAVLEATHELACTESLVGLALFVFTARVSAYDIAPARTCRFRTGFGGLLGNKGAVAASLAAARGADGEARTLCVVHAHLASDLDMLDQRNAEYAAIVGAAADASILSLPAALGDDDALDVLAHDVIVWQGDLNYRLGSTKAPEAGLGAFLASFGPAAREAARDGDARDDAAVREALAAGDWAALAARDQLDAAIARGDAFVGFREAPKMFPPTYKLVRGTAEYKANRRPAWCDRVLWKAKRPSDVVACGRYASVATCVLSDHHPVSADLAVEFH